jgi:uncharacterized heparinase superfamily protein
MSGPRSFRFLNEDGVLRDDWDDATRSKLWLYNLHYFDDLNCEAAPLRDAWHAALMDEWIERHPPGAGTGWEPYPTSLRIGNWIKRHLDGRRLSNRQSHSLAVQTRWLMQRLEWHLLGNHLFANAKALVLAGLLFDGDEAQRWLAKGLSIIRRELPEQVLADGGNFERSPMYHAIFLEDLLDLVNVASVYPGSIKAGELAQWREVAGRMLGWMRTLTHPDGEISLFNDAAVGIAPAPAELDDYATRLDVAVLSPEVDRMAGAPALTVLRDSGYIRIEGSIAVTLLDVAPVGPDYLPGHAHADTLSFELSVSGQRVIVNGGTSRYGLGSERLRERSTAAHSTVVVDGQNSSEVWGGFRVARRARPFGLHISRQSSDALVSCAHDGYRRLAGRPVHQREWRQRLECLTVSDHIDGHYDKAEARYHFHPGVGVASSGNGALTLTLPQGQRLRVRAIRGQLRLELSQYASAFGVVQNTTCAVITADEGEASVEFHWT